MGHNEKDRDVSNLDSSKYEGSKQQERNEEITVEAPWGVRIRARGYDLLTAIVIVGLVTLITLTWQHVAEAKVDKTEIIEALHDMRDASREATYVNSLSLPEREKLNLAMPDSLRKRLRQ